MNIDWDAQEYSHDFSFVHHYGEDVLKLLDIHPGDTVIDLGCGNGALTMRLSEMGAHAIGIDASSEMLEMANSHYPELVFRQADALNFTVEEPAEALFSNAVFHWIDKDKQGMLMTQINRALKLRGQLVCEFGGKGCAGKVHEALQKSFKKRGMDYTIPFYFPSIGEYTALMEQFGFKVVYAILFDRPTRCQNKESGLRNWIRMFDKVPFQQVDADIQEAIIAETEQELRNILFHDGDWFVDYVRIRIKAIKEKSLSLFDFRPV
ncbi:trans-aconitate 2-methyltransferase [Parabacteroides sp. Marseille-P3160]|uniref:class I SAM-dependent methyltransferase n=1 Tax=Parabacteroides sp. Marseille-P3160 TaxID=1917887 RepID=UPI0009BAAD96|nr:class I SAM-dependent methyltransferase [Parabacteroides sp. Marseille-P3160]